MLEIERLWKDALISERKKGVHLFSGNLYRLIGFRHLDRKLILSVGPTSYKEYYGTNLHHPEWYKQFGDQCLANPLGVSACLETLDKKILLALRSKRVAEHQGQIHVIPAGQLSPSRGMKRQHLKTPDAFAHILKEMREELGAIEESNIKSFVCTGLIRNKENRKPELVFSIRLKQKLEELSKVRAKDRWEIGHKVHINADRFSITKFLIDHYADMVPAGHAALFLHGNYSFGLGWFRNTFKKLQRVDIVE